MKLRLAILLTLLFGVLGAKNHDVHGHFHANHKHESAQSSVDFSGSIGLFGKSSFLADAKQNARRDSYSFGYANLLFGGETHGFDVNLGLSARAKISERSNFGESITDADGEVIAPTNYGYISAPYVAHVASISRSFGVGEAANLNLKAGRFEVEKSWLGHYIEGAAADLRFENANIWALWANEQAHITGEFSTDFNYFKSLYDKQDIFAAGADFAVSLTPKAELEISSFVYYMKRFFFAPGAEFVATLTPFDGLESKTRFNYTHLNSKFRESAHAEHAHEAEHAHGEGDRHGHLEPGESSYIAWIEQRFTINEIFSFGAGFWSVGKNAFHLANFESASIFEAHEHAHEGFGVIAPGSMHNGSQTTNAYNARAKTAYAFVETLLTPDFALALTLRHTDATDTRQRAISLGARYMLLDSTELGGIIVAMDDKDEFAKLNRSYTKAYVKYYF